MSVKTTLTWEAVTTDGNFTTKRMKVLDGWLVRVEEATNYNIFTVTHVADPEHQWVPTNSDDA